MTIDRGYPELETLSALSRGAMPVDGLVTDGQTFVDESMMTGENLIGKKVGDTITSATINQMVVLTTKQLGGSSDTLAQIVRLVEEAQGSKAPIAALADKISLSFCSNRAGLAIMIGWYLAVRALALCQFLSRFWSLPALVRCTRQPSWLGFGKGAENGID